MSDILAVRGKQATVEEKSRPGTWPISVVVTVVPREIELLMQSDLHEVGAIIRGRAVPSGKQGGRALDYFIAGARIIVGALSRFAVATTGLQVAWFENLHRKWRCLLFVGNGNLGANDGFVAYVSPFDRDGEPVSPFGLFCPSSFALRVEPYPSLVAWRDGRVTINHLRYAPGTTVTRGFQPDASVYLRDPDGEPVERPIAPDILWATSGQHLVRQSKAVEYGDLIEMVSAGWFYDLNHVFLFPWLAVQDIVDGDGKRRVFVQIGYRELLDSHGRPRREEIARAMRGEPMNVPIGPPIWHDQCGYRTQEAFADDLRKSLVDVRGYMEVDSSAVPSGPGEFRISGDTLTICYLPGTYPHNLVGVSRKGQVVFIQITYPGGGKMIGGRSAVTLLGAARAALAAANRALASDDELADCLLLDNGGDVMLWAREPNGGWEQRVKSELQRDSLRSLIAVVGPAVSNPPPTNGPWPLEELLGAQWESRAGGSVLLPGD